MIEVVGVGGTNEHTEVEMPWFPEFVAASELARREIRADGQADPVAQYFEAITKGDTHRLETVWPGEVVIFDPRAGEVRGHHHVREFVRRNHRWLAEHHAGTENVAATRIPGRAVVEVLARVIHDGHEVEWPLAVVAESSDDQAVVFRTYCSQWPVDGLRHLRAPILEPGSRRPGDVVGRYLAGVDAGDVDAVVSTFAPGGYLREPIGAHDMHRGSTELQAFFARCFSAGGGIGLQDCAVTDDGVRCAVEYNCVRWGSHDLAPQAGIAVFERGPDGLLAAARIYDDVEAPVTAQ